MIYRILLLSILILPACGNGDQATSRESQIGRQAPPFKLREMGGGPVSLEDFKGEVLLIRFWSTQCKSCREQMPELEALYKRLRPFGMTLLGINAGDTPGKIADFMKGLDLTFPLLIDRRKELARQYLVFGVPTSFIIDREGIIRKRFFGDLSVEEMEKLIRPLL